MTEEFNRLIEELKLMFVVSQAMAKNNFDSTYPVEGKTDNPDPPPTKPYPGQQPSSEFTKKVRLNLENWGQVLGIQGDVRIMTIVGWLNEACKRLDESEEFVKECREYINGSPVMSNNNCKGYAERLKKALEIIAKTGTAPEPSSDIAN